MSHSTIITCDICDRKSSVSEFNNGNGFALCFKDSFQGYCTFGVLEAEEVVPRCGAHICGHCVTQLKDHILKGKDGI